MEEKKIVQTFNPLSRKEWRKWLEKNHAKEKNVRVVILHKNASAKGIHYEDAVQEALCFGWIDSTTNKRDDESYLIYFAQRSPTSKWSSPNKLRVAKLIKEGLMTPAGKKMIDLAKNTGTWEALESIEAMEIPSDLQKQFNTNKTALKNFQAFSPSSRKIILGWIFDAKRHETREKRIEKTIQFAVKNLKAYP